MAPKVPDILPIHRWGICLHPYLSSEFLSLFEVLTMMEALLCQLPNSSIRKLLEAFNSCLLGHSLLEPSHATGKKPTHPARARAEEEFMVLVHSPQLSSQLTAWSTLPDRCKLYFHTPPIDPLLHCWWQCKWVKPRWRTTLGLLKN